LYLTQKNEPRAATGLITKRQADAHPETLDALLAEQARVHAVSETLKALAVAENTAAVLTIGQALLDAYDQLKASRALMDYDDLIAKAGALLADAGGVSWVHFKLDGGIDHILVDEAQDTSPAQWAVIRALAGDFFTGEARPADETTGLQRTVFAVGDEKQSIYSFQGADPTQFGSVGEAFRNAVTQAGRDWRPVEMAQSWRSVPAVLNAVDAVFADANAADGLTWTDHAVRHLTTREGEAGLVELWPLAAPGDADADDDPWDAPLDQVPGDDPLARLAETVAAKVRRWLDDGEALTARDRPVTPGDIMILVRTRGAFADAMVRALKDRGVAVAGSDRLVLTQHIAVMDLIALGRFALLPDDDLNTATVLKGPFVGLDEDRLFQLAHRRTGTLWREVRRFGADDPAYAPALATLGDALARADTTAPFEFFNAVLAAGGRRALLARLGPEAADPVDEFMALALDFERDHVPSLEGFLHWMETGETEVKRDLEQAGGAVRVMTVHGAKGLQAPVVFLVDNGQLPARQMGARLRWGEGPENGDFVLWPAFKDNEGPLAEAIAEAARTESEREYRRLLYVAMTRAEDRLYVCGWRGKRDAAEGCWHRLVEAGLRRCDDCIEIDGPDGAVLRVETVQTAA
ncbi:MAG: UvrD-helicase domain-containing protein, partial [Rhodospirillaceae bacterium]